MSERRFWKVSAGAVAVGNHLEPGRCFLAAHNGKCIAPVSAPAFSIDCVASAACTTSATINHTKANFWYGQRYHEETRHWPAYRQNSRRYDARVSFPSGVRASGQRPAWATSSRQMAGTRCEWRCDPRDGKSTYAPQNMAAFGPTIALNHHGATGGSC
jgi:hypothetical protein